MQTPPLPNEVFLNIFKFVSLKELRFILEALHFDNKMTQLVIKEHVKSLGIPFDVFINDSIYIINNFFEKFYRVEGNRNVGLYNELLNYIKNSYEHQCKRNVYSQIVNEIFKNRSYININYFDFYRNAPDLMKRLLLSGRINLDDLYLMFIRNLSDGFIYNRRILKRLLRYQIDDSVWMNDYYWINYTKDTVTKNCDEKIEIFRYIINNKHYINSNMIRVLFNNTLLPINIVQFCRYNTFLRDSQLIEFIIWNRIYGNAYQITNYTTLKNCYKRYNKMMYLHLIREERRIIKGFVRIRNPYSGKKMKINSNTYNFVLQRLQRDGYIGTIVDLEVDTKHEIDRFHKFLFGDT
jgi:hypothetical protein